MILTQAELIQHKKLQSDVPCGTCTACCKSDTIILRDDEYEKYPWHWENNQRILDRKPDGTCVNLTPSGCGVHGLAPDICKRMDCRVLFLVTPKTQRRIRIEQNPSMRDVYDAGKKRQDTLK
jgi:hypothetical protein